MITPVTHGFHRYSARDFIAQCVWHMMTFIRVQSIDHVELYVPDRCAAARWYQQALGLEIVAKFEHWARAANGPLMIATADGVGKLALFEGAANQTDSSDGFRRVAFGADGAAFKLFVENSADRDLRNKSGEPINTIRVVHHDQSLSVYFHDPWGHALEVTTYDVESIRTWATSRTND